jgi:hypothetical protein
VSECVCARVCACVCVCVRARAPLPLTPNRQIPPPPPPPPPPTISLQPDGPKTFTATLGVMNATGEERNFTLYLPCRGTLINASIGVAAGETVRPMSPPEGKPVVVYGTSILHGAAAGRAGRNAHPGLALLLRVVCVNGSIAHSRVTASLLHA